MRRQTVFDVPVVSCGATSATSVVNRDSQGGKILAEKKTIVCGIYQNGGRAERTVPDFLAAGFSQDAISVSLPDKPGLEVPEGIAAGVTAGGALSVRCDTPEQVTRAKDLLKQTGAQDVYASGEEADKVFVES
jgi:hypothetical protein